jgi:hypothetical protein
MADVEANTAEPVYLGWAHGRVQAGQAYHGGGRRSIVIGISADEDDPAEVARQLTEYAEHGGRLAEAAGRLHLSPTDLLRELSGLAEASPAGEGSPASGLTPDEERALRLAGSLVTRMPAFRDRASTRTAVRSAELTRAMLDVKTVAEILGKTEGRVRQRLTDHTLLGVRAGGGWRIPAFQFDDDTELPGWDRVMGALPHDVHPLTVARFLDSPQVDLDVDGDAVTPREWLRFGGDADAVVNAAAAMFDSP